MSSQTVAVQITKLQSGNVDEASMPLPLGHTDIKNNNVNMSMNLSMNMNTQPAKTSSQKKGNLQSMLTSYEQQQQHQQQQLLTTEEQEISSIGPSDISIQLDAIGRDRSSTLGSFRDRGLTFDSEFDLGLGFAVNDASGPGAGVNGPPEGGVIEFAQGNSGNNNNSISGDNKGWGVNIVSANSSSASGAGHFGTAGGKEVPVQIARPSSSQGETSSFFSGMFGTNEKNGISNNASALFGHTPPSAVATSYEGKHFGKRMRSGSISGRLRSMSDLEERGVIDRQQKGVLKDLIISGDDDLQVALDKWDGGDKSAIENIVSTLKTRKSSDIDLLGDLDLDFLSMGQEFGDVTGGGAGMNVGNATSAIPIPGKATPKGLHYQSSNPGSGASTPRIRDQSPSVKAYDGVSELEFNGDYSMAEASYNQTNANDNESSHINNNSTLSMPPNPILGQSGTKLRADSLTEFQFHRNRANSLAFGALLDEPNSSDLHGSVLGKWMDRTPGPIPEESKPLKKRASSHVVGANGGLYIINNDSNAQDGQTQIQAQPDISKMTKAEIAAMKRREREQKKALKEAERQAKREKKEREAKIKKALKASKQEKKAKKAESAKKKKEELATASDEEPRVIVSGTGRPRSLSDPNLSIGLDANGLMHIDHPPDWVGAYSPDSRKIRIERFLAKRNHRVWVKKVKYNVRKNFADSRLRVKGRFVKKEDELLMRDLMSLT